MVNVSDKTRNYLEMLECEFDKKKFQMFAKDLLNLTTEDIIEDIDRKPQLEQYKKYIDCYQIFAKYQDIKRKSIGIFIVKLLDNKNPANARTLQRNFIAHLMDEYGLNASISAIYSENDSSWRLSFVKQELTVNVGKLQTEVTPAKRFSYLVGKDEPNHTAEVQLLSFIEDNSRKFSIDEIEKMFSVEKVTEEFFENYKENYLKLKEHLEANKEFIEQAKKCGFTSEEFTKKLMGQIVFLYFLQKKGWLGVKLVPQKLSLQEYDEFYEKADIQGKKVLDKYYTNFNGFKRINSNLLEKVKENEAEIAMLSDIFVDSKYDEAWGTGEKRFIRKIFINCINRGKFFFEDYLEPFFYRGLNYKRKNQYFGVFNCKIPFLNGGLFEPLDNYDWELANFGIANEIFSNDNKTGILDFFDIYNFTINEEEPLEKDVAVDPEMLGKIFEELLDVKDRKSKGAYYTPREIVHYMCQESLANYLVNKVNVDYNEVKDLIQYGELIRDEDFKSATSENHLIGESLFLKILEIDKALRDIKVADPSVGSGAFPLGMLNEIVKIRDILTTYMLIYYRNGYFNKNVEEDRIVKNRSIYKLKWDAIRNSIYAVDIENSAVDITKLRLWLSIVVDQLEVPKTGPEPLPNLDCKIMQGNSLIDEFKNIKLLEDNLIEESKNDVIIKSSNKKNVDNQMRFFDDAYEGEQYAFFADEKRSIINELIKCKLKLFGENNVEKKKELLKKIDEFRKNLFEVNFRGSNTLNELIVLDKSHSKPYFSWKLEFIEVFVENDGFDIVIGNPPYVGEKGNKEIFEEIANTKFGKEYKQGKMDLFYYFFHKGIDILNSIGELKYITTNYYITATGGNKLRKDFKERVNIRKLINFNEYKIFKNALGQHNMITELTKTKLDYANTIFVNLKGDITDGKINHILYEKEFEDVNNYEINYNELFDGEENYIRMTKSEANSILLKIEGNPSLDELCYIHQGLKSNSDKVTDAHLNKYDLDKNISKGDGIFVLNKTELLCMELTEKEMRFIKPLFKNSDIYRYKTNIDNDEYVIYTSKENYLEDEDINLKNHFNKYEEILRNRAEVEPNGTIKLYSLTRPREQFMYETPKIVAPYKSRGNVFGYNECDWYASGDVYYINLKKHNLVNLKYLLALLNSKLYYTWFYYKGKRKGYLFELYQKPLSETPIKIADNNIQNTIEKYIDDILLERGNTKELEEKINKIIYDIYGLTENEIEIVERLYQNGNIKE